MPKYSKQLPRQLTIEADTRERKVLIFPAFVDIFVSSLSGPARIALRTRRVALPFGDYRLAEFPDCCVIERKGSFRELSKNLTTSDAARQARSLERLAAGCRYPYLLVEESFHRLFVPSGPREAHPSYALLRLLLQLQATPVRLLCCGQLFSAASRTKLGEAVATLLILHALLDNGYLIGYTSLRRDGNAAGDREKVET